MLCSYFLQYSNTVNTFVILEFFFYEERKLLRLAVYVCFSLILQLKEKKKIFNNFSPVHVLSMFLKFWPSQVQRFLYKKKVLITYL